MVVVEVSGVFRGGGVNGFDYFKGLAGWIEFDAAVVIE